MANPDYSPPGSSTMSNIPTRSPFACPLSLREMSGSIPFIALRPCGCVFSDASIRAVVPNLTKGIGAKAVPKEEREEKPEEAKPVVHVDGDTFVACPNCGTLFDPTLPTSISPINPTREVQEVLLENLLTSRAAAKSSKKRKAAPTDSAIPQTTDLPPPTKVAREESLKPSRPSSHTASPAPRTTGTPPPILANGLARSVHQKLAEQEQKRMAAQAGMSDAVKAMFRPKDGNEKTGGAADFFGRTFNRYAA